MSKKITTSEWINRAISIHGTEYDYSKVNYIDGITKVCIICPKHGEFWQIPNNHLKGCGCPKCSCEKIHRTQRNSKETFIQKSNKIHNNKYDYSLVDYINNNTKVKIFCHKHGIFEQNPSNHISGQGCPKCSKELNSKKLMMSSDEFIKRSKLKYNNFYNYDKVIYNGCNKKVIITCPIHGDFKQTPSSHLNNSGCPICGRIKSNESKKLTLNDFIEKANIIHENRYDYSKVKYIDYNTSIIIICPIHGEFSQTPDSHLQGKGCPICANNVSKNENEIAKLLENNGLKIERRNREILANKKELDIFIPSKNIAIEYNGLYWHSEEFGKLKNYHLNKLLECNNKNIKLIQIFEDEYINHKDIVINKLYHILNIELKLPKIMGRKCLISEIDSSSAKYFLNKYHIQGFSHSTIYLGAFYNDELIAVMTFKKERNNNSNFELNRFASNYNYICQGVGGKLFSYFVKNYNPKIIKSFADRRWTINEKNNVYLLLGFKFDKYIKPDYCYFIKKDGIKRQHKFNFRKKILHKKYGFSLSMTENEMTKKLNAKKIWNCGLIKYVWKNEKI